ncbi:MAG: PulJ/GspJ family protein [Candidatus Eremiobacter antarcticus]
MRIKASKRRQRGTSLSELLIMMVIFGLVTGFVAVFLRPLLQAPRTQQTKVDALEGITQVTYKLQRDLRQSHMSAVFSCTNAASPVCTSPGVNFTAAPVVAILSPRPGGTGNMQWDSVSGFPVWQGYQVYWSVQSGGINLLYYKFASITPTSVTATAEAGVSAAVHTALTSATPGRAGIGILQLDLLTNASANSMGLRITAQSIKGGHTGTVTVQANTAVRNLN